MSIPSQASDVKEKYAALSYTWGNGSDHAIECDGRRMEVREALWMALQRLRRRSRPRMLWIDAICIDQQSEDEKTRQIKRMRDIYAFASRVIVYLGDPEVEGMENNDLCIVFQLLHDLARHLPPVSDRDDELEVMTDDLLELLGFPERHDRAWTLLSNFFQRPWFKRVWIIQEVCQALAQHTVTMICGRHNAAMEIIASAVDYIEWRRIDTLVQLDVVSVVRVLSIVRQYWVHNIFPRRDHTDERVLAMLCRSRDSQSTDPRDKIFGTFGLMKGPCEACAPNLSYMDVIWSQPGLCTKELYLAIARQHIKRYSRLDMLSAVEPLPMRSGHLPSWVPDWQISITATPFYLMHIGQTFYAGNRVESHARHAGHPPRSSSIRFESDERTLVAFGAVIDSCATITPPLCIDLTVLTGSIVEQRLIVALQVWLDLALQHATAYTAGDGRAEAFARTAIADSSLLSELKDSSLLGNTRSFMDQTWFERYNTQYAMIKRYPPYMDKLKQAIVGRCFFITAKGRMGLCSPGVNVGSLIVVLEGGRTPYFVSPADDNDSRILLSDCYVHGIMHGEVLAEQQLWHQIRLR